MSSWNVLVGLGVLYSLNVKPSAGCLQPESTDLGAIPTTHFQLGDPRTASTLQFVTICAALAVKNMDKLNATITCGFGQSFTRKLRTQIRGPNEYLVIKDHKLIAYEKRDIRTYMPQPAWIFETTRNRETGYAAKQLAKIGKAKYPTVLAIDTADVAISGYQVARPEYETVFALTPEQSNMLYEWLYYWDILRMCCGVEMSQAWRDVIIGPNVAGVRQSKHSFGNVSSSIVLKLCGQHNITKVEHDLMRTTLYHRMHVRVPMLGKVSDADGPLTGHYCKTCAINIRDFGLGFHEDCIQPPEFYKTNHKDSV